MHGQQNIKKKTRMRRACTDNLNMQSPNNLPYANVKVYIDIREASFPGSLFCGVIFKVE